MIREARLRRRRIKPEVRVEVISRDGMTCRYCGCEVTPIQRGAAYRPDHLHLDHVTPWAMGGSDDVDNLVVSCARCNLTRAMPPAGSAAVNRLLWEKDGEDYYWRLPRFRPPGYVDQRHPALFMLEEAAEILACPVADIIVKAATGALHATGGTTYPVRVAFGEHLNSHVERRMDELGWVE